MQVSSSTAALTPSDADEDPVRVLHISDIHFRAATDWDRLPVPNRLAEDAAELRAQGLAPHLVCVTGDVAFSGKAEEYVAAERWLRDTLLPAAGLTADALLIVAGNHDVDRGRVKPAAKMMQAGLTAAKDPQAIKVAALPPLGPASAQPDSPQHDLLRQSLDVAEHLPQQRPPTVAAGVKRDHQRVRLALPLRERAREERQRLRPPPFVVDRRVQGDGASGHLSFREDHDSQCRL